MTAGMTLADARARIPDLWVETADTRGDAALLDAIAEDCDRISPVVMVDPPDGLLIDITGCDHLFGGEAALRLGFSRRMQRAGLHVRTVIAGAADTARALVRFGRIAIVPPGGDVQAVRSLPVAALALPDLQHLTLLRAGLKTIGELADRPSRLFAARFSEAMTLKLARIQGLADPSLAPRRPIPALWVERRFADPIGRNEDAEAALAELMSELCSRLREHDKGARAVEASFFRTDGAVRRIAIQTGRPVRQESVLLRLFREKLDALTDPVDPGFGFDMIRLSIHSADSLASLQESFDGREAELNEISDLAARLSARLGAGRVIRFLPEDTHDPDRATRAVPVAFDPVASGTWPTPAAGEPPMRPSQIFRPPQHIKITLVEAPDGPPRRFTWRKKEYEVKRAEGPERIMPEWWRAGAFDRTRDYYRVEDSGGRRFWIFRAGAYGGNTAPEWYLHGMFA